MAPRPHWKGYLKLSLVSCPINLYPAVSAAEKVGFRQINAETGNRLRQQLVDSVTGEVVEAHKKARGYEVGENQFLTVKDEELEAAEREARSRPFTPSPKPAVERSDEDDAPRRPNLRVVAANTKEPPAPPPALAPVPRPIIENSRTIELDRFIPRSQIDPRYFNTPYYIAPSDQVGLEAFSVIRDAMANRGLVGMGRIVLSNRERPLFIEPMGLGLRGIVLRYAHEIRDEKDYFEDIEPIELPDDVVQVTELILDSKRQDFDPAYLEDRYRTVLVEKLREKQALMPLRPAAPAPSPKNVVNLMEALKASLGQSKPPASSKAKVAAKRAAAPRKGSVKRTKAR